MARVFSWKLKENENIFGYLAKINDSTGKITAGYTIRGKIDNSEVETLKEISSVVNEYTEAKYKEYFNKLREKALSEYSSDIGTYDEYFNIVGSIVMLTGKGEKGDTGKGTKGDTGATGKGRNIICYACVDSGFTPTQANIVGGKLDTSNWHITYPTDPQGKCVWGDSNEGGSTKVVYMSNADFDNDGELIVKTDKAGKTYTWAKPIRISGEKGDNGADGDNIEFIYKLVPTREDKDKPEKPTNNPKKKDYIPVGWTDNPVGISDKMRAEYMCNRTKDGDEDTWSDWNGPVLWASWGEDGNDGDGIEYIFAISKTYGKEHLSKRPSSNDPALKDHWQDPEIWDYIRESGLEKEYPSWTDDPIDVEETEPYEYVSIRRRKNGVFGEFEEPKLWAHYGKNGEKGDDGTSVNIKGRFDTLGHLLRHFKKNNNFPPAISDAFAINAGEDGVHIWVYMEVDGSTTGEKYNPTSDYDWEQDFTTGWYYEENGKKYWFSDCGSFKGESGDTTYVHIKYAKDWEGENRKHREIPINGVGLKDICFTENNGETPGQYIAIYTDTMFDDNSDFDFYCGLTSENPKNLWNKWSGDDGQSFGQEQIFFRGYDPSKRPYERVLTEAGHGYEVGESVLNVSYKDADFKTADFVPTNWTDVPMGLVRGQYNFEWVATRRLLEDGTWSYFSPAALYNSATDTPTHQVEYSTWSGNTVPTLRNATEYTKDGVFDEDEWRKDHASTGPWSDNPEGAVWYAAADGYMVNSNSGNVIWNDWQVVKCKGDDGINRFTSFAFVTLDPMDDISDISVTGGNYDSPIPTSKAKGKSWSDGPSSSSGTVWMTAARFSNINGSTQETEWSKPKPLNDTSDFETIYSPRTPETLENPPMGFKKIGADIDPEWLKKAEAVGWYDEPSNCPGKPVYMATNIFSNGNWEGWKIIRVLGEKGEKGDGDPSIAFLKNIFGEDIDVANGALIREYLAVKDGNDKVVAMINGSSAFTGTEGNILMIAAGMDGVGNYDSAAYRVYSDGSTYASNAYLSGNITAEAGKIGNFIIEDGCLVGYSETNDSILLDPTNLNITFKNASGGTYVDIDETNGFSLYDNNLDLAVQVSRGYYSSLSQFARGGSKKYHSVTEVIQGTHSSGMTQPASKAQDPQFIHKYIDNWDSPEVLMGSEFTLPSDNTRWSVEVSANISCTTTAEYSGYTVYDYSSKPGVLTKISLLFYLYNIDTKKYTYLCSGYLANNIYFVNEYEGSYIMVDDTKTDSSKITGKGGIPAGRYKVAYAARTVSTGPNLFNSGSTTYYKNNIVRVSDSWDISNFSLTATPVSERTELFANGFGYAFNENNYVGVIRENATSRTSTSEAVAFEAKVGSHGLRIDNEGAKLKTNNGDVSIAPFAFVGKFTKYNSGYSCNSMSQQGYKCSSTENPNDGKVVVHIDGSSNLAYAPMLVQFYDNEDIGSYTRGQHIGKVESKIVTLSDGSSGYRTSVTIYFTAAWTKSGLDVSHHDINPEGFTLAIINLL